MTSALLVLAAAAAVAWAIAWPYAGPAVDARAHAKPGPAIVVATLTDPALSDFAKVWDINLQRPLIDHPAPAVAAPAAPIVARPPVGVKLIGTVIEPGHSVAIFIRTDGKTEVKAVGESVAGDQVLEIKPESATLRHGTDSVVLQREKIAKVVQPRKG
jgi:hypothetical protein